MRFAAGIALLMTACEQWNSPTAPIARVDESAAPIRRRAAGGEIVIQPQCADPSPLIAHPLPGPSYTVWTDPAKPGLTLAALISKYGVSQSIVIESLHVFGGNMTAQAIAGLRCESNVLRIEQAMQGGGGATTSP